MAGSIFSAFGSDKVSPRYLTKGLTSPLTNLGKSALESLQTGGQAAEDKYNAGTARQESLMGEQEGVARNLLNRRLNADPNALLQQIGNTAFGFINPNVVNPLSQFDVNSEKLMRSARGLNPAAVDSTSERLRNARVASGRYLDTARQAYGALPGLYNSAYGQGVQNDTMAKGYIPDIMRGYRNLDTAPAEAAQIRSDLANQGAANVGNINSALKSGVYGYKQGKNVWDKLAAVDSGIKSDVKDMVGMAGSLAGMGGGQGGGGMPAGAGGGGGIPESVAQGGDFGM
jgi:hypothetical protein